MNTPNKNPRNRFDLRWYDEVMRLRADNAALRTVLKDAIPSLEDSVVTKKGFWGEGDEYGNVAIAEGILKKARAALGKEGTP